MVEREVCMIGRGIFLSSMSERAQIGDCKQNFCLEMADYCFLVALPIELLGDHHEERYFVILVHHWGLQYDMYEKTKTGPA